MDNKIKKNPNAKHWGSAINVLDNANMFRQRVKSYLSKEYGGEGGIRTLDTLPYTHFPGVLLQPLGHLTKLFVSLYRANGALL